MSHLDLILWGNTKAALSTFAKAHPAGNPLLDADGNVRPGVDHCWWAGDGKMMKTKAVIDQNGNVVTPATYITGFVMLLRIHTVMYEATKLTPAEGETEQWHKSGVVKYIKDNGTPGTTSAANGSIPYYELSGVRIFRPASVEAWLAANDLPGHIWVGGNNY